MKAPLIVRGDGDRDYDSHSHLADHEGSVTIENLPLERLENVRGNVSITAGTSLADQTSTTSGGYKVLTVGSSAEGFHEPHSFNYRHIDGDFTALLLNERLRLSAVSGRVDVNNEFGETEFVVATPLSNTRHRLMSEGGKIALRLGSDALKNTPLLAVTECGTMRVAESVPGLVDANLNCWPGSGRIRRSYRGFASQADPAAAKPAGLLQRFEQLVGGDHERAGFDVLERLEHLAAGVEQSPGLDVLSRGGTVQIDGIEK